MKPAWKLTSVASRDHTTWGSKTTSNLRLVTLSNNTRGKMCRISNLPWLSISSCERTLGLRSQILLQALRSRIPYSSLLLLNNLRYRRASNMRINMLEGKHSQRSKPLLLNKFKWLRKRFSGSLYNNRHRKLIRLLQRLPLIYFRTVRLKRKSKTRNILLEAHRIRTKH